MMEVHWFSLPRQINQASLLDFMSMMTLMQRRFVEGTPALTPETTARPARDSSAILGHGRLIDCSPPHHTGTMTPQGQKFPFTCQKMLGLWGFSQNRHSFQVAVKDIIILWISIGSWQWRGDRPCVPVGPATSDRHDGVHSQDWPSIERGWTSGEDNAVWVP